MICSSCLALPWAQHACVVACWRSKHSRKGLHRMRKHHNHIVIYVLIACCVSLRCWAMDAPVGCCPWLTRLMKKFVSRHPHATGIEDASLMKLGDCPICFVELTTDVLHTACEHYFHKNCLEEWFKTEKKFWKKQQDKQEQQERSCPMCREEHCTG